MRGRVRFGKAGDADAGNQADGEGRGGIAAVADGARHGQRRPRRRRTGSRGRLAAALFLYLPTVHAVHGIQVFPDTILDCIA